MRKLILFYALLGTTVVILGILTLLYLLTEKRSAPAQEIKDGTRNVPQTNDREVESLEASTANFDLRKLNTAKGLHFPRIIRGYIDLSNLTDAKGLHLPEVVEGSLSLSSLTSAEGLQLPRVIRGGWFYST